MDAITITDWVGYAAMLTVLISFLIKDTSTFRLVNSFGCLLFVAYGLLLEPILYPIVITSIFIFGVNVYNLFLKKTE